jgi:tetratricopeptide (TPR) repeat protein
MNRINWVTFAIAGGLLLGSAAAVFALGNAEAARADAAYAASDYAQAATSYARAAQLQPWRADLWDRAGASAGLLVDWDRSLTYFAHNDEHSEDGWIMLGYAWFQKRELTTALDVYQRALQAYPQSAELYNGLAMTHHLLGDRDGEREAREGQARYQPENVYAHFQLALLWSTVDTDRALAELSTASKLSPAFDDVIETMRTTLNIANTQNDEAEKLVTVGRGLGLVGEWALARDAFQLAIDADAAHAEAWAWLGEAEQQIGKDGSAALDQALALDKQSPIVRGLRAQQWSRLGDYERMRAEYAIAARLEPENAAWQAALGEANLKLGDLAAAIGFYKRATELAPQNAIYWRLLAMTCAENGAAVEEVALPAALKAAELAPNDAAVLDTLGFTYHSSGRYANAEETLKAAIELDEQYWPAYIHLAMNYLVQGNKQAAHDLLARVRDADPGVYGQQAKQLLAQYFP